ncbi:MAG: sulfatase-like hydrolase/transferase [Bryobacterales bacterium]|nr:sulfatase-like hydrolase/transferase [Bryobacterales bacterium]
MRNSSTRRSFLGSAAGLASALTGAPAVVAAGRRTNIVLCMGDDHGWNETAYNGHPYLRTPVLDEMAAAGLRFDRFYSAAPVCSPTRGSIMTGRHPNRYGTFGANWSTRPEEITIAHILRKAGYACGHFGKWHLGPVKAASPTNPGAMGFEEWLSHDNFFEIDPHFSRNGGPVEQFKGESSEIVVSEAIRFIGKAKQNRRPFFTVIWFGSPHAPYSGVEQDLALYKNVPDKLLQARFAEITALDRAMGQLRRYLKSAELRQDTLLWYCGDNGVPPEGRLTTPFRGHKGQVYEGGLRVPGIIEWPERIRKPRATEVNAVTSDMLPTICELAGQPLPPRPLDGVSLIPLLEGGMRERPKPICFWQYDQRREMKEDAKPYISPELQQGTTPTATLMDGRLTRSFRNYRHPRVTEEDFAGDAAILGNRYKLVAPGKPSVESGPGPSPSSPATELYDVRDDRGETKDLIQVKPEIAKDMERQLREWQRSVLASLTGADYR